MLTINAVSQPAYCQHTADTSWVKLFKKLDGGFYYTIGGKLFVQYTGEYNNGSMSYRVWDYNRNLDSFGTITTKKYGDNRIIFDFNCVLYNGKYILEIENEKGEKFYLRFDYDGQEPDPVTC